MDLEDEVWFGGRSCSGGVLLFASSGGGDAQTLAAMHLLGSADAQSSGVDTSAACLNQCKSQPNQPPFGSEYKQESTRGSRQPAHITQLRGSPLPIFLEIQSSLPTLDRSQSRNRSKSKVILLTALTLGNVLTLVCPIADSTPPRSRGTQVLTGAHHKTLS